MKRSPMRSSSHSHWLKRAYIGLANCWHAICNSKHHKRRKRSMRCRDAREWLSAQRDGDRLEPTQINALQEHLADCSSCRAFEQHERHMESLFASSPNTVKRLAT